MSGEIHTLTEHDRVFLWKVKEAIEKEYDLHLEFTFSDLQFSEIFLLPYEESMTSDQATENIGEKILTYHNFTKSEEEKKEFLKKLQQLLFKGMH